MGEAVPGPYSRKRKLRELRRLRSTYGFVPWDVEAVDEAPFSESEHAGERSAKDLRQAAPKDRHQTEEKEDRWGEPIPPLGENE